MERMIWSNESDAPMGFLHGSGDLFSASQFIPGDMSAELGSSQLGSSQLRSSQLGNSMAKFLFFDPLADVSSPSQDGIDDYSDHAPNYPSGGAFSEFYVAEAMQADARAGESLSAGCSLSKTRNGGLMDELSPMNTSSLRLSATSNLLDLSLGGSTSTRRGTRSASSVDHFNMSSSGDQGLAPPIVSSLAACFKSPSPSSSSNGGERSGASASSPIVGDVPSISLQALIHAKNGRIKVNYPTSNSSPTSPAAVSLDGGISRSFAPTPSPRPRVHKFKRSSSTPDMGKEAGEATLKRCEESVARLERLYQALESISSEKWNASASQTKLETQLRANPYYHEIQLRILDRKVRWLQGNPKLLASSIERKPPTDLGLSSKARECSRQATLELMQLRQMEIESKQTLKRMLGTLSSDVPVFAEEVRDAMNRAGRQLYDPAKIALSEALDKQGAASRSVAGATVKRGHLNQQSVDILENWLVSHFDHPYPSMKEKKALVVQTGMSLVQVSNWLSNARIRIWRPAVESLSPTKTKR